MWLLGTILLSLSFSSVKMWKNVICNTYISVIVLKIRKGKVYIKIFVNHNTLYKSKLLKFQAQLKYSRNIFLNASWINNFSSLFSSTVSFTDQGRQELGVNYLAYHFILASVPQHPSCERSVKIYRWASNDYVWAVILLLQVMLCDP